MPKRSCKLICYDIRDERCWRKVEKLIKGYGERVQYSIFRCWLTERQYRKLLWQLEMELSDEDSLLIVPLPDEVQSQIVCRNLMNDWERTDDPFIIF